MSLETNLARKGIVSLSARDDRTVDADDLLGRVAATHALRLTDLEILAWLSSVRAEGHRATFFSRSQIARDLFGRDPGGRERLIVNQGLERLASVRLSFDGYDGLARQRKHFADVGLLDSVQPGRGHTSVATFAPWLSDQLDVGYCTYLDWDTMRALRGLAKRLWIYVEAAQFRWETFPRYRETEPRHAWIALGEKARVALGSDAKSPAHFKEAISKAAERINRVDPKYSFHIEKRGGGNRLVILDWSRTDWRTVSPLLGDVPSEFPARSGVPSVGDISKVVRWRSRERFSTASGSIFAVARGETEIMVHAPGCPGMWDTANDALETPDGLVLSGERRIDVEAWLAIVRPDGHVSECPRCDPPRSDAEDRGDGEIPF